MFYFPLLFYFPATRDSSCEALEKAVREGKEVADISLIARTVGSSSEKDRIISDYVQGQLKTAPSRELLDLVKREISRDRCRNKNLEALSHAFFHRGLEQEARECRKSMRKEETCPCSCTIS